VLQKTETPAKKSSYLRANTPMPPMLHFLQPLHPLSTQPITLQLESSSLAIQLKPLPVDDQQVVEIGASLLYLLSYIATTLVSLS
jgi:hypothetical protein